MIGSVGIKFLLLTGECEEMSQKAFEPKICSSLSEVCYGSLGEELHEHLAVKCIPRCCLVIDEPSSEAKNAIILDTLLVIFFRRAR